MSAHDFTSTHVLNVHWAHMNAEFLVFHRAMLWRYEQALATVGWTGGLIYFDEAGYRSNWASRDIFSDRYFGGEGTDGQCLTGGQFSQASGYQVLGEGGTFQCLQRCGDPGNLFFSPDQINGMLMATSYPGINDNDSSNFHANGHITVGGSCDVGNPYWSPRDPFFYLHHAYVDKVFWRWQNFCPEYRYDYEGNLADGIDVNNPEGGSFKVVNSKTNRDSLYIPLDSWTGLTPYDVLDTNNDALCYTYSKSIGDVDFTPPACPNGAAANINAYSGPGVAVPPPPPPPTTTTTTTTANTASATVSATATLDSLVEKDTWFATMLNQLIFKGVAQGFGDAIIPSKNSTNGRRDFDEYAFVSTSIDPITNTTNLSINCQSKTHLYQIPSNYTVHKATCSRIIVKPTGQSHVVDMSVSPTTPSKHHLSMMPFVLFSTTDCDPAVELALPIVYSTDPNADYCPRFMTKEEIARHFMSECAIHRSTRELALNCVPYNP
ncbi:Di-copper centre-containing protein [Rhizoclosmatium globosum]|uniref:Di-copper centre-containing protein n=1 Tax=Rhizoclosmatium globosum TaxID=329046 RepID=A0A1Y2CS79_9FUNG|nr:Di-copper centre-containing protein [Rhizoclosmatium globosum]|eukprot:ORY49898.1 Di-copper centre-containing protein [Rhizoclosmatium globosum]